MSSITPDNNDRRIDFNVTVFGSSSTDPVNHERFTPSRRKVEVKLQSHLPSREIATRFDEFSPWVRDFSIRIVPDMKYTQRWYCMFCHKPARETILSTFWDTRCTPVVVNLFVMVLCDAGAGPCSTIARHLDVELGRQTDTPWAMMPPDRPAGPREFPLAGGCASCHREEAAEENLLRCSSCQLIRYCG